jgi:phosphopantetheinyl transferase
MTELWLVDLEAAAPALEALERDLPRLSGDDRARALRPSDARERRHRLVAYMGLRVVLERAAGAEVRGQRFVRGARGKPRLAAGDIGFSLSHTGGLALIGVARAGPIGVDLERARALRKGQGADGGRQRQHGGETPATQRKRRSPVSRRPRHTAAGRKLRPHAGHFC